MREILFRGKRTDNGEWVKGFYAESKYYEGGNFYRIIPEGVEYCDYEGYYIEYDVDPKTVGQYTGLTDKNGKKIFEGDIVRLSYAGKNQGLSGKSVVTFKSGKFGVEWGWHKEFVSLDGFANTTMEVIGNIHDNPELLKGGAVK